MKICEKKKTNDFLYGVFYDYSYFSNIFRRLAIMNLELLESYGQNYPEEHDGKWDLTILKIIVIFDL